MRTGTTLMLAAFACGSPSGGHPSDGPLHHADAPRAADSPLRDAPTDAAPDGRPDSRPIDAPPDARPIDAPPDAAPDARPIDAPLADVPTGSVSLVQQAQSSASAATLLTAQFATAPAAGDVLLMIGGDSAGNGDVISGVGSSWTRASGSFVNSNVEIWFTVATGSGTTVTMSSTMSPDNMFMSISDWTGLSAATPLDVATPPPPNGSADGSAGTTADAGSATTTGTDLLVFAVSSASPQTFGPLSGFDQLQLIAAQLVVEGFFAVVPAGSYEPTTTSPGAWDAALAAFHIQ